MAPKTFLTVWELLWYNCSPACRSSAQWLYGGVNGNLLQDNLGHMAFFPGLLQPESPCPRSRPLGGCPMPPQETLKHSKASLAQSLWDLWILVCTRFCLSPLSISGGYGVLILNTILPPTILLGLLLCLWTWGIFFWWGPTFSCWLFSNESQFWSSQRRRWAHILLLCQCPRILYLVVNSKFSILWNPSLWYSCILGIGTIFHWSIQLGRES